MVSKGRKGKNEQKVYKEGKEVTGPGGAGR
jgi:hypothetical protein